MWHVPSGWVVSHRNEPCHIWMRHCTCQVGALPLSWLIQVYDTELIHMLNDTFTCDTTHSYVKRLIHVWHDSFKVGERPLHKSWLSWRAFEHTALSVLQCITPTCVVVPWIRRVHAYMHAHRTNKRKDMCTSACRLQEFFSLRETFRELQCLVVSCSVLQPVCCSVLYCVAASTPPFFAWNHTILITHGTWESHTIRKPLV